ATSLRCASAARATAVPDVSTSPNEYLTRSAARRFSPNSRSALWLQWRAPTPVAVWGGGGSGGVPGTVLVERCTGCGIGYGTRRAVYRVRYSTSGGPGAVLVDSRRTCGGR